MLIAVFNQSFEVSNVSWYRAKCRCVIRTCDDGRKLRYPLCSCTNADIGDSDRNPLVEDCFVSFSSRGSAANIPKVLYKLAEVKGYAMRRAYCPGRYIWLLQRRDVGRCADLHRFEGHIRSLVSLCAVLSAASSVNAAATDGHDEQQPMWAVVWSEHFAAIIVNRY
jgi:hypothetical protein